MSKQIPFGLVPVEVSFDSRLNARHFRVLIALFSCRNRATGLVNPSREYLAKLTKLPVQRISAVTSDLVLLGWLKKQGNGGRSTSVNYTICVPEFLTDELNSRFDDHENTVTEPVTDSKETVTDSVTGPVTNLVTKTVTNSVTGKEQTNEQTNEQIKKNKEKENLKFVKPSVLEITEFIREKNYVVDADVFFNHYESNGWVVGKSKMKCWRSALANWNSRNKNQGNSHAKYRPSYETLASNDW